MKLFLSLAFATGVLSAIPDLKTYWRDGWYRASVGHNGFKGVMWYNPTTEMLEMHFNKKPDFNEFNWWTHAVSYADQWHVETAVSGFDLTKLGTKGLTLTTDMLTSVVEDEAADGTYELSGKVPDTHKIWKFTTITLSKDGADSFCGGTFVYGKVDYYVWNHDDYQAVVYAYPKRLSINFLKFADPVGDYESITYSAADCTGPVSNTVTGSLNSVNEWFSVSADSDIMSMKFSDAGKCHNLSMGKKSTNWVQLNAPGIRMRFKQNTVFEPTYYWMDYNMMKSESDEALGGYHVHKWPLPDSEMNSPNWGNAGCGDTGGHWNPYGISKPAGGFESGREQEYYEIGDLSSKFGSLADKKRYKGYWCDFNLPLFGVNSIEQRSIVFHAASGGARKLCYNLRNSDVGERNNMHFQNSWTHDEGDLLFKLSLYQPGWNTPTALHVYVETGAGFPEGSNFNADVHVHEGTCTGLPVSDVLSSINSVNFKPSDDGLPMPKGSSAQMSASKLTNSQFAIAKDVRTSMLYKRANGAWMAKDTMYSLVVVSDTGLKVRCFEMYKPIKKVQVSGIGQLSSFGNVCMAAKKKMKGDFGGIRAQKCKSFDSRQVFYNDAWRIRMNNNANSCLTATRKGRVGLARCKMDSMQMWAMNDNNRPALASKMNMCIRRKGKKMIMVKC